MICRFCNIFVRRFVSRASFTASDSCWEQWRAIALLGVVVVVTPGMTMKLFLFLLLLLLLLLLLTLAPARMRMLANGDEHKLLMLRCWRHLLNLPDSTRLMLTWYSLWIERTYRWRIKPLLRPLALMFLILRRRHRFAYDWIYNLNRLTNAYLTSCTQRNADEGK